MSTQPVPAQHRKKSEVRLGDLVHPTCRWLRGRGLRLVNDDAGIADHQTDVAVALREVSADLLVVTRASGPLLRRRTRRIARGLHALVRRHATVRASWHPCSEVSVPAFELLLSAAYSGHSGAFPHTRLHAPTLFLVRGHRDRVNSDDFSRGGRQ